MANICHVELAPQEVPQRRLGVAQTGFAGGEKIELEK